MVQLSTNIHVVIYQDDSVLWTLLKISGVSAKKDGFTTIHLK